MPAEEPLGRRVRACGEETSEKQVGGDATLFRDWGWKRCKETGE